MESGNVGETTTGTEPTTSATAAFLAAINTIVSLRSDFYANDVVQVWDIREGLDDIRVAVVLGSGKHRGTKRSQLTLDVEMTREKILSAVIDGREIAAYMRDRDPDFVAATAKVVEAAEALQRQQAAESEVDGGDISERRVTRRQAFGMALRSIAEIDLGLKRS